MRLFIISLSATCLLTSAVFARVLYVATNGANSNTGYSWSYAKKTISTALSSARSGDEIWVAAGTYRESITLKSGVKLFGGFLGNETNRDQRDWKMFVTTIEGYGQNPVVRIAEGAWLTTQIDGFVIQNGVGLLYKGERVGGGIYCYNASPTISHNVITYNTAQVGGGIYCETGQALIANNIIYGNTASRDGGAIRCAYASPVIANNLIYSNTSAGGGGIEMWYSSPSIVNNTIAYNTATYEGGALACRYSAPLVANNIITFNSSGIDNYGKTPTLDSNCVYGNTGYDYNRLQPGSKDIHADPKFINSTAGNYHLLSGSPCIDKGDGNAIDPAWYDIDDQYRVFGAGVDIGADEWTPYGPANVSLTPTSASLPTGIKLTLTSRYSHAEKVGRLTDCYLLINRTLRPDGGIYIRYNSKTNRLYVGSDDGYSWIGSHAPGANYVLENSYFKLYCGETKVSMSGTVLTVAWKIEVKATMAGKSCKAWQLVDDDMGQSAGWDQLGTFTVMSGPVSVATLDNASLMPGSGFVPTGKRFTFTTTYSDSEGYKNISKCYLLINTSFSHYNAVEVFYDAVANKLYLNNERNTGWGGGYAPGQQAVIESRICKVYCADTTVTGYGDTLTINWSIELYPILADKAYYAWMYVSNKSGLTDGWDQMGAFSVLNPPENVKLTPYTGNLPIYAKLSLTSVHSSYYGYWHISRCNLLINDAPPQLYPVYLSYDVKTNLLYIKDDVNSISLGGFRPGEDKVIENGQLKLYCKDTTVSVSGNTLTVCWKVELKPSMVGKCCSAWLLTSDNYGLDTGWCKMGDFKIHSPSSAPVNAKLTPKYGTLAANYPLRFSSVYSDRSGYEYLSKCYLMFKQKFDDPTGIILLYDADANRLYLRNENDTASLGGYAPGSPNTIENRYCALNCADTKVTKHGDTLVVNWSIELKRGAFDDYCGAWMYVIDDAGVKAGWDVMGNYTVY